MRPRIPHRREQLRIARERNRTKLARHLVYQIKPKKLTLKRLHHLIIPLCVVNRVKRPRIRNHQKLSIRTILNIRNRHRVAFHLLQNASFLNIKNPKNSALKPSCKLQRSRVARQTKALVVLTKSKLVSLIVIPLKVKQPYRKVLAQRQNLIRESVMMHLQNLIRVRPQNIPEIPRAQIKHANPASACPAGHLHGVEADAQRNHNSVLL